MRKLLVLLITVLALFLIPNKAYAIEKINPNAGFRYQLKRFQEKIILLTKISPGAKADYYQVLLNKRLAELIYTVNNKDVANIEKTSQRYETTAGNLTELITANGLVEKAKQAEILFSEHLKQIEAIKGVFEYDTGESRLVQNDINSLTIYFDLLKSVTN